MIRRGNKWIFITTCCHYYHALPIVFTLPIKKKLFSNYQILSAKSRFLALQSLDILKFSAQSLQT